jgi:hypothetical protein
MAGPRDVLGTALELETLRAVESVIGATAESRNIFASYRSSDIPAYRPRLPLSNLKRSPNPARRLRPCRNDRAHATL